MRLRHLSLHVYTCLHEICFTVASSELERELVYFLNTLCIFPYSVSLCGNISMLPSTRSLAIRMIRMANSRFLSWFCQLCFFGFMDYIALDLQKKAMFSVLQIQVF